MSRLFSTVAVMAMAIGAVLICLRQTIEARELIGGNIATPLIVVEVLLAAAMVTACAGLLRRRLAKSKSDQARSGRVRQTRRKLSTV